MAAAVATVEQVHAVGRWRDTFARGGASEDQYLIGHLGGGDIVFWPYNR
jgi:hypothetical protein